MELYNSAVSIPKNSLCTPLLIYFLLANRRPTTGVSLTLEVISWVDQALSVSNIVYLPYLICTHVHFSDGLVYDRAATSDFDKLANMSGDSGWAWESMLTYYEKVTYIKGVHFRFLIDISV